MDNSGIMAITPDQLRSRLQVALTEAKIDATELARTIQRSPDYVRDFMNGRKNSFKPNDLANMELALSVMPGYLSGTATPSNLDVNGLGARGYLSTPPASLSKQAIEAHERAVTSAVVPLPVYSAAEGGPGVMVVSTDPIDLVVRPWFMREVRDGFAVLIVGESMEPAFEPGDLAIVNPRLPAVRNKNMIFTTGREGEEFKATIKRLVRWTDDTWFVRQFNEPKDFELSRREWPDALRVVGKLEG